MDQLFFLSFAVFDIRAAASVNEVFNRRDRLAVLEISVKKKLVL